MKALTFIFLSLVIVSCSSGKKDNRTLEERDHENLERDYIVRDASSSFRPGWIEDAEIWAKNYSQDLSKYRFFSFETEPKVSRTMACNLAKANVKADIAGEISTFIDKTINESSDGDATIDPNDPKVKSLREYVTNSLTSKIQNSIYGASIIKTYWEKRNYLKDKGAKKDYVGYSCGVLIRMPVSRLNKAIDRAVALVTNQVKDKELKAKVEMALKDSNKNFNQKESN